MARDAKEVRDWINISFSFLALTFSGWAVYFTWSDRLEKVEAVAIEVVSKNSPDLSPMTRIRVGFEEYPLFIDGTWDVIVSNISGSTISLTSISVHIELSGGTSFGGHKQFSQDGMPLKLPISLEAGKSIGISVTHLVPLPKTGADAVGVISLVPKTESGLSRRMNELMVSAHQHKVDIFGNKEVNYLVFEGKVLGLSINQTAPFNPSLKVEVGTARKNKFTGIGAWYSMGK